MSPIAREGVAREVLRRPCRAGDVVLDADPAIRAQPLDHVPADPPAVRPGAGLLQQQVDEVDPGLDRHHEARLETSRQAQVRVARRARYLRPGRVARKARDVVDLQAEQVPDAVRKEHARESRRHGVVGIALDDPRIEQQPGDQPVREQVDLAIVRLAADRGTQHQLQLVHSPHEVGELPVAGRVGARDVRGVAAELRTGVDEEGPARAAPLVGEVLVMQHRRVLVERDDVAVGQLLVALADGRAVGEVGLEFGCSGREGVPRRDVAACGHQRRPPHALELIGRLDRAVVMQLVQQPGRVGGCESPVGESGLPLADEGDASSRRARAGRARGPRPAAPRD